METIIVNGFGDVRSASIGGRDYLVAPVTMIVEGVLPGSAGSLYYPPDEIGHNPDAWNGMPLTAGHPVDETGRPVSARAPEVMDQYCLGHVFNVYYLEPAVLNDDGSLKESPQLAKLAGEAWFDVDRTMNHDRDVAPNHQILPRLRDGLAIEISTGLFTDNHPARTGATFNSVPYTHIARNYRPDHLAVLASDKGACSIGNGCGVNVSNTYLQEYQSMFATNCGGVGGKPGRCKTYADAQKQVEEHSNKAYDNTKPLLERHKANLHAAAAHREAARLAGPAWKKHHEDSALEHETAAKKLLDKHYNGGGPTGNIDMDNKNVLIQYLTNNCECWKNKHPILGKMTENELRQLKKQFLANRLADMAVKGWTANQLINNSKGDDADGGGGKGKLDIPGLADFLGVGCNPAEDPIGFVKELTGKLQAALKTLGGDSAGAAPPPPDAGGDAPMDGPPPPPNEGNLGPSSIGPGSDIPNDYSLYDMGTGRKLPADPKGGTTKTMNRRKTAVEWLSDAPAEIQAVVNNAIEVDRQARIGLIEHIIANHREQDKPGLRQIYQRMDVKQLRLIANSVVVQNHYDDDATIVNNGVTYGGQAFAPLYAGGGPAGLGGQTNNALGADYDENDIMPRITIHDVA